MVASVPELANRHCGRPNLRASSVATTMALAVGWAKWVPCATWSRTARTMAGCAWPASAAPYPPCRSMYSLPSTSYTLEPLPWLSQTGCGSVICQLDVTPPASTPRARAASSADLGWRRAKMASCSAMSRSMTASLLSAWVGTGHLFLFD